MTKISAIRRVGLTAAVALLFAPSAIARGERDLPKKYRQSPYMVQSLSVGYPNSGWHLRAKKLRDTPYLKVKRSSRFNQYAHPALVLMLRRSSREIGRSVKGSVMLVGDLSSERGGFLNGHRSHQSGRDADIGFYVKNKAGKPVIGKRFLAFDAEGRAKDGSGLLFDDYRNWLLVQAWATDHRAGLSHIFVSRGVRSRLLKYAKGQKRFKKYYVQAAKLLKQPQSVSAHDDHFHVRISCPETQLGLCHNESRVKH
ncbi:MAG: penicillin-insensitive murein endopeptidase [Polyangiaceae bacterium]|nr:penicillin-insensitive murein endopeptidase [Polyangiaceae bacterium]